MENGYKFVEKQKVSASPSLNSAVSNAAKIINKSYLENLESMEIVPINFDNMSIDISKCGKFYKLEKLVFSKDENFLDKLTTIANVVSSVDGTLATIINSDGNSINYYIGIISKKYKLDNQKNRAVRNGSANAFSGAVEGNFSGSELKAIESGEMEKIRDKIFNDNIKAISSVSGVVALRDKNEKNIISYVQGIENMVNSTRGKKYTVIMIADPLSKNQIQNIKTGYEILHTQLSVFLRNVLTVSENESFGISASRTEGMSKAITEGISRTTSRNTFNSSGIGTNAGISVAPFGIGVNVGLSANRSNGTSNGESYGTSSSRMEGYNNSKSYSESKNLGSSRSLQLSYENKTIKDLLDKIDISIKRLDMCESFGAFECAAYILANNYEQSITISSNYNAIMRGEESFIESSQINTWNKNVYGSNEKVNKLLEYIKSFVHPNFYLDDEKKIIVTPSSVINGKELAIQMGIPKKSIKGLTVIEMTPFGRNAVINKENCAEIGELYYMGKGDGIPLSIDVDSLSSHTFITGSTGSGKSNTIYNLISEMIKKDIKFLVVEPAKGEYKNIFGNSAEVFGTNPKYSRMLKINPFKFPNEIHVFEHIDRLTEIFNVCWPMYAAMPAVLKEALLKSYENCGWNLTTSENQNLPVVYPTFIDLLDNLSDVIKNSAYSEEVKSNYTGSLITRVKSLTNGLNGLIFVSDEIESSDLFDKNVIVDLSRIGSMETKSLIMGILIMRLSEYRMSEACGINVPLKHITVLEEAHNILKRTNTEQNPENPSVSGKSVELISNAIAEMRTYGEGFIIADQSPSAVDVSAIKNTNTKIIMRLPDEVDRRIAGKAAALSDGQIDEISKLQKGVAVIYQNEWLEPLLCKINKFEINFEYIYTPEKPEIIDNKKFISETLKFLLKDRIVEKIEPDIDFIKENLYSANISTQNKISINTALNEYMENGKINLLEPENFAELSKIVSNIMNFEDDIESIVNSAENFENLNCKFNEIIDKSYNDLSDKLKLSIIQCFLRFYVTKNIDEIDIYSVWREHILGRRVI